MTMTIEQVRDRLASWYGGSEACLDVKACAELGDMIAALDAHITQPAQAVDVGYDNALNDAGWAFIEAMQYQLPGPIFNNVKPALKAAIEKWLTTRALSAEKAGWRDIATAPNDGTVVLLAIEKPGYSGMALAYQKDGQWHSEESDAAFGGWTHWMPLPASPTPDKEG